MRRLVVLVVFAAVATTALALASAMAAPDPAPVVETDRRCANGHPERSRGQPSDVGDLVGPPSPRAGALPHRVAGGPSHHRLFRPRAQTRGVASVWALRLADGLSLFRDAVVGHPSDAATHACWSAHRLFNSRCWPAYLGAPFRLRLWRRNSLADGGVSLPGVLLRHRHQSLCADRLRTLIGSALDYAGSHG